jgi:hypothetical protein
MYLSQFARGFDHTFVYYLLDDRNQDCGFGFYDENGNPKKSADYMHNLTAILDDDNVIDIPGDVNYTIENQTETVHDLLLQKSDGTFELVIWNERAANSNVDRKITVDLGAAFENISVYDPTIGVEPIEVPENPRSIEITLADYPIIIEFALAEKILISATPSASVNKLIGNKNALTVAVTELYSDGTKNIITETVSINNNAAGTYQVGKYRVYVNTKGNTQIREIYIVK